MRCDCGREITGKPEADDRGNPENRAFCHSVIIAYLNSSEMIGEPI
jgi:hypothetical protein